MAKNTEKVFEFDGSQNLFTTPIDITGLRGDTYDYELETFFEAEALSSAIDVTFNNDTTANYRNYYMRGDGSTAPANTADSDSSIDLGGNCYSYPSLNITSITGDSSGERVIDSLMGLSSASTDTKVQKYSSYWKNTADELTSIQLSKSATVTSTCRIILYRTPKAHSQGNWIKVDSLSWAAETAEKSFTGLDGDVDKKYKSVWSGDKELNLEINNDTTTYARQYLQNAGGTISANNSTSQTSIQSDGDEATFIINAETGVKRLVTTSGSNTASAQQSERAHWYDNTATNITTLDCTPVSSATGTATLYKKQSESKEGVLPWELVETVAVSGDYSAGTTFSNLLGDSVALYKATFEGANTSVSTELRIQFNADTGSNYVEQYLRSEISTASAGSSTKAYIVLAKLQNGDESQASTIIYPKTGDQRPTLTERVFDENAVEKLAQWYTNTATEITSLKVYAHTTDTIVGGTLKLWRLK